MTRVRILEKGVFECFEPGLADANGEPVNAEVSAVAWDGKRLVFGSDKNVPGDDRSPVFALECVDHLPVPETLAYYTAPLVRTARKYEDFALTAAGDHLIATTGFDRVDEQSAEQHHYNRLLIWPCDAPEQAHVAAASDEDGVRSSVQLRSDLVAALNAPYFKIEGLAAVPGKDGGDDRLLFGVREVGQDHENFDYVCRVVGAPYRVVDEHLVFTGDFDVVYDFDPSGFDGVRYEVGLSSLEYDPHNRRVYLLTSFETEDSAGEERIGGYLWALSLAEFDAGRAPALVENADGGVLEFANKAEGVAVMDAHHLFIVYDNDRELALDEAHPRDRREPHEAPYTLLATE